MPGRAGRVRSHGIRPRLPCGKGKFYDPAGPCCFFRVGDDPDGHCRVAGPYDGHLGHRQADHVGGSSWIVVSIPGILVGSGGRSPPSPAGARTTPRPDATARSACRPPPQKAGLKAASQTGLCPAQDAICTEQPRHENRHQTEMFGIQHPIIQGRDALCRLCRECQQLFPNAGGLAIITGLIQARPKSGERNRALQGHDRQAVRH